MGKQLRKQCGICIHSVKVDYTVRGKWDNYRTEYTELFCIAAPPSVSSNKTSWGDVIKGYNTLCRYEKYPIVSKSAPCSLYTLSTDKKKIDNYKIEIKDKKQAATTEKEKKRKKVEERKIEKVIKKEKAIKMAAKKRVEREKVLKDKLRKIQQKEYKDRKKDEKIKAIKNAKTKANEFDRFEMIDLEE